VKPEIILQPTVMVTTLKLKVNETFNSIQTEGILQGRPAYFIRLSGCNLNCSFCDTDHKKGKKMSIKKILEKMEKEACSSTVILTGGEPFMHEATTDLVTGIIRLGWFVQIETNGTVLPSEFPLVPPDKSLRAGLMVVCSPKTKKINPDIAKVASVFKYVVKRDSCGKDGLPIGLYKTKRRHTIMLSPMFEKSKKKTQENINYTVKMCQKHGYYFTLQYHKFINIP